MAKNENQGLRFLQEAIDTYYQYNPDTLTPLLMLALAAQNRLDVTNEPKKGETVFASIRADEVVDYDWCRLNPPLNKRIKAILAEGKSTVSVVGSIPADLKDIYDTFHQYDTVTVVQEYHHRKGRLVLHTENVASDSAQRQYATIVLAEQLISAPHDALARRFLNIANGMLVDSGIQPRRPRIRVAQALKTLLKYDGQGIVYNPFAGCAIAAAMVGAGEKMFVDGDANEKLLAIARLLCYGVGSKDSHVEMKDSLKWLQGAKPDYVLSTYLGYPGGKSAFDHCLAHCLEDFTDAGKYAGIAAPKDIFEKRSPEMEEALRRDWVDTIALLPFGEVAILIDAGKPRERKHKIWLFDLTHPMLCHRNISQVLGDDSYAQILRLADVKKKGFLKSLFVNELEPREGFEIVTLGDLFKKKSRQVWSLSNIADQNRVLAYIDRNEPYDQWEIAWMNGIEKKSIVSLFSPAYKLTEDCLIVNDRGNLEPRLFDADPGDAFFQDGLAFSPDTHDEIDFNWLIQELNEPYVKRQLHPYGLDEMVPEPITEEQVLALKLYKPLEQMGYGSDTSDEEEDEEDLPAFDRNADKLPQGTELRGENNTKYIIHQFLGNGYFGYTYSADSLNLATGERKEVVLKEFFPQEFYHREGIQAVLNNPDDAQFKEDNLGKFIEEAKIMHKLGMTPDSHIVPAFEYFRSSMTDTFYYVMPFLKGGSLEKLQMSGFSFSEEMLIRHVIIPLCKALHVAHRKKILHLDIKPENILVDDNGDAVLIDFGVAKQFDENNRIINRDGASSRSCFAPPELKTWNGMVRFGEQPDIFGLAATLYYLATDREEPHPIMDLSEQDQDIRFYLDMYNFSDQFIDAIVAGLQFSAFSRPKNAQAFLNLFPGCETITL